MVVLLWLLLVLAGKGHPYDPWPEDRRVQQEIFTSANGAQRLEMYLGPGPVETSPIKCFIFRSFVSYVFD